MKGKEGDLVNYLEGTFSRSLHIRDTQEFESKSDGDYIDNVKDRNICEDFELSRTKSSKKHLGRSATFPNPGILPPNNMPTDEEEEPETALRELFSEESTHRVYSRSTSLPTPLRSAMKGGRAQQGASPKKLTVKWAPDVYDPPQTLLYHTVKSKKQNKTKSKKTSRKGQKGSNSSRGSNGKDKKHVRKVTGSSDKCNKSFGARDRMVDSFDEFHNFDSGSSESFCGSSFLKTSVTKVHYSVAEAL